MLIIAWNVRGLGSWKKKAVIKESLRKHNPSIVILVESKSNSIDRLFVKSIWSSRFLDWASLDANGSSEGIVILWNDSSFSTAEVTEGIFSLSIHFSLADGFNFWLTGVYSPSTSDDKPAFFQELHDLSGLCGDNWILGGDFNIVRWPHENSNGVRLSRIMSEFNSFIFHSNLIDIPLRKGSFTWSDFRCPPTLTLIDRFLITEPIRSKFIEASATRLERTTSDHFPISLALGKQSWGPTPFKFENMWLQHHGFLPFLANWWSSNPIRGWPGHGFIHKLKALKKALKVWNTNSFGCLHFSKASLYRELNSLDDLEESSHLSQEQTNLRTKLREDLLSLAAKEESFWRQRCKEKWLLQGDENSRFFHLYMAAKRRKNTIVEILSSQGVSLLQDADIEAEFIAFYSNLFKKRSDHRTLPHIISWDPISPSQADALESPFSKQEVFGHPSSKRWKEGSTIGTTLMSPKEGA